MDKKLLLIININYLWTYLAYSIFPPYLPKVAEDDKGVDQQTVGLIMCFWYIGYAILAVMMSHIHKHVFTRKNSIIWGLICLSIDFIIAGLWNYIQNKMAYILAYSLVRFLHGASQAFVQVTTYSIIAACFNDSMAKVVGMIEFSWGAGIALGPLIAEFLYNISGFSLPWFAFSGVTLLLSIMTYFLMSDKVEGLNETTEEVQVTDDSIENSEVDETHQAQKKIPILKLFGYKLFWFGILGSFFNLILYVLLEPILSGRLSDLGVKEKNLGEYFCIQPFVYSFVSIFVDPLVLKYISKRMWLIIGFFLFSIGFVITGPSSILFFFEPSKLLISIGLVILGIGSSLSFVPLFPELMESVIFDFEDRIEDLNNTVASLMNASYGSAALGQL